MADRTTTGKVNKFFNTPLDQLPTKLKGTTEGFDQYVLIGKQGENWTVVSSESPTESGNLISNYVDILEPTS